MYDLPIFKSNKDKKQTFCSNVRLEDCSLLKVEAGKRLKLSNLHRNKQSNFV